ncbi:MAG: 50S ribosomal protein L30 [Methanobrevibacter sp.]|nr:50S ribosomal protein L30 [Candidatus Methanoflexus mossambicus]
MYFVIRVRGTTGVKKGIADTLTMLRLNRLNHGVLIDETPSYKGMLQKSKDYITWGEIDAETLVDILSKRGKLVGGDKLTEEYLKDNTEYNSFEDLANALLKDEVDYDNINLKPVFRLHPPRKGYEGIRIAFKEGGSLGFRGELIKDLIKKMI